MTRAKLRQRGRELWPEGLERATLEELRDGLLFLQAEASPPPADGIVRLDDGPADYESAMREFFAQTLVDERDESFVQLWLAALELWLAIMTRERRRGDGHG